MMLSKAPPLTFRTAPLSDTQIDEILDWVSNRCHVESEIDTKYSNDPQKQQTARKLFDFFTEEEFDHARALCSDIQMHEAAKMYVAGHCDRFPGINDGEKVRRYIERSFIPDLSEVQIAIIQHWIKSDCPDEHAIAVKYPYPSFLREQWVAQLFFEIYRDPNLAKVRRLCMIPDSESTERLDALARAHVTEGRLDDPLLAQRFIQEKFKERPNSKIPTTGPGLLAVRDAGSQYAGFFTSSPSGVASDAFHNQLADDETPTVHEQHAVDAAAEAAEATSPKRPASAPPTP